MSALDPVIHAPARLQLMSMLTVVDALDFARAREELGVSDSVLSKHLSTLGDAGYVKVTKSSAGGRRTTQVALTRAGRAAYSGHVSALRALIDLGDG
jgi:DNA-binding MarR family transcriptional regulator